MSDQISEAAKDVAIMRHVNAVLKTIAKQLDANEMESTIRTALTSYAEEKTRELQSIFDKNIGRAMVTIGQQAEKLGECGKQLSQKDARIAELENPKCTCKRVMTQEQSGLWICWDCDQKAGARIAELEKGVKRANGFRERIHAKHRIVSDQMSELASVVPQLREQLTAAKSRVEELEAEKIRILEDYERLKTQLRLNEEHSGTMARDFDVSIAVVQNERDSLRADVERLKAALKDMVEAANMVRENFPSQEITEADEHILTELEHRSILATAALNQTDGGAGE